MSVYVEIERKDHMVPSALFGKSKEVIRVHVQYLPSVCKRGFEVCPPYIPFPHSALEKTIDLGKVEPSFVRYWDWSFHLSVSRNHLRDT